MPLIFRYERAGVMVEGAGDIEVDTPSNGITVNSNTNVVDFSSEVLMNIKILADDQLRLRSTIALLGTQIKLVQGSVVRCIILPEDGKLVVSLGVPWEEPIKKGYTIAAEVDGTKFTGNARVVKDTHKERAFFDNNAYFPNWDLFISVFEKKKNKK